MNSDTKGHLAAFFAVLVWGMTFASTKTLLNSFTPLEILIYRFSVGYIILWILMPKFLKFSDLKQEMLFLMAGAAGVTVYFLFENIALTYTYASNVGLIVAMVPLFTAITSYIFLKERLTLPFFIGFLIAISGVAIIIFNGAANLKLNPRGDILAVMACISWSFYSVLVKKLSNHGYNPIMLTRRIFFYGLILMFPLIFIMDLKFSPMRLLNATNGGNILFLGIFASGLCFAFWSYAVNLLGAIKTSVYIYLVPVLTYLSAYIILDERLTLLSTFGGGLTLLGLLISENRVPVINTLLRSKA